MTALLTVERARELRRRMTPPEARLWVCLRGKRLAGLKFRRQHPIGPYVLDFYCAAAKLAVEVDGQSHERPEQIAHDRRRTAWLREQGVRVVRLAAEDVRVHLDGVVDYIRRTALERQGG
ncbi:endonuclease domain-containing protein [Brevundimonas sp. BR2-1]|uniref:endonuclease domain-containing protein n=1 Tax=Brevundimonas sp. BR2-1 TaxID=3031123 RepID=UPI003098A905